MKEPHGLFRDDGNFVGKRPYGLTLLLWNSGRSATWDVTVVVTLENAYLQQSVITSASAAETAAVRKKEQVQPTQRHPQLFSSGTGNTFAISESAS